MKGARGTRRWLAVLVWAALASVPGARAQDLTPGQIIDKVVCRTDASQSYALYLPSNYSALRKWPVLYALDAGARGRLPVERFRDAAEKYGYIVAGSNNSRNGPPEVIATAIRAMLADTLSRVSIDDRRVYFTGFSGGARVAASVANAYNGLVAGVIGCGAGFPEQLRPSSSLPFVYFGTAGIEDFNFIEMKKLDQALESFGIAHRLAVFQGAHDWPPQDVCLRAIEWMELQAMRTGIQEKREPLIDQLLQKAARTAASDESSGRLYDAFLEYTALARDFSGLRDVSAYQRKATQLKGSKQVQQGISKERGQGEAQGRWMARLMGLREDYASAEDPAQAFRDLSESISDLNRRAETKEDSEDRLIARRVRGQLFVQLRQEAANDLEFKRYARAAFNLSLAVHVGPGSARLFYNLACAQALAGRKREALAALKTAVEMGFNDVEALETDPALDGIRKDPAFQKILEGVRRT